MLSRFAYHITGVAVMALAIHALYLGTPIKKDSSPSTAQNKNYWNKQGLYVMRDLEINIGYVEDEIIAIIETHDGDFSFIAVKAEGKYFTKVGSTMYQTITKQEYPLNYGERQMILNAIIYYESSVRKLLAEDQRARNNIDPALN